MTLLRNLGAITHLVNNRKDVLGNQRFLSFQPTHPLHHDPAHALILNMAEGIFTMAALYAALNNVLLDKAENLLNKTEVYAIIANTLQWKKANLYLNTGTNALLVTMLRPLTIKKE
jgi:hypothetical protein